MHKSPLSFTSAAQLFQILSTLTQRKTLIKTICTEKWCCRAVNIKEILPWKALSPSLKKFSISTGVIFRNQFLTSGFNPMWCNRCWRLRIDISVSWYFDKNNNIFLYGNPFWKEYLTEFIHIFSISILWLFLKCPPHSIDQKWLLYICDRKRGKQRD